MKDRIEETILQLDQKVLAVIGFASGAITWTELIDTASKGLLLLISALTGILAIINYWLKNQKLRKENELLDQQKFTQALANKEKEDELKARKL